MSILQGLRVVELSAHGAAAMAAKQLADWGAVVTILEPPNGTPLRNEPPYYQRDGDRRSATWTWLSRGKTAVRVGEGAGVPAEEALAFCQAADVVLAETELTRAVLGLRPSEVRASFEGTTSLVLISPFATDGPYAHYRATELGASALGGWMSQLGAPGRQPVRPGGGPLPRVAGVFALVAALVGLRHVRQGGRPQFIELSMQAVAASICTPAWLTKSIWGMPAERIGNLWPIGVMECADGFVGVPPLTATHWEMLCQLMGLSDVLEHPEGRDPMYRLRHSAELYERVKPWLRERTRMEIFHEAQAWRLPAAPVQTIADRLACPQLEARGFWQAARVDAVEVKLPRVAYSVRGITPAKRPQLKEEQTLPPAPASKRSSGHGSPGALPFAGLRVLDLTAFWSGPYATMLLGTLGADVIKVESVQHPDAYRYTLARPERERWYEWGPVWNDGNCDKRSLTLDLTSDAGTRVFERLVPGADIVISNFSNRVMPGLGLTPDRLLALNPRLIVVEMPGYGPGGPWEQYVGYAIAFEQLIYGAMTGYPDDVPFYAGGFCDPLVGMHTVAAIELALRLREETGRGTVVEVPQCEILDSLVAPESIAVQLGAPVPERSGNKHPWMAPHDAYRVAGDDAWLTVAVSSDREFAALVATIGRPELARDARFASVQARKEHEAALDRAMGDALRERDGQELEAALQAVGVKACRVAKAYELDRDPGLVHVGFFEMLTRQLTGTHPFKKWPFRFADISTSHKRPPPLLGEHNVEVLSEAGLSAEETAALERAGVIGTEPLALSAPNA